MDIWLDSLITETPQQGFELAITLSRRGVKYTQPDPEVLKELRAHYANSAEGLTAASHVVALNFQTVGKYTELIPLPQSHISKCPQAITVGTWGRGRKPELISKNKFQ